MSFLGFLIAFGHLLASARIIVVDDAMYEKFGTTSVIPNRPSTLAQEPRQRKLRGSKVNDIVLGRLKDGQAHKTDLQAALASANKAPGSLSTALSSLQKSGQVRRLG